jgi:hypothetical protein
LNQVGGNRLFRESGIQVLHSRHNPVIQDERAALTKLVAEGYGLNLLLGERLLTPADKKGWGDFSPPFNARMDRSRG